LVASFVGAIIASSIPTGMPTSRSSPKIYVGSFFARSIRVETVDLAMKL
jgi:hypothetical protein